MIDRLDSELGIQRAALGVATRRQEVLASNIANADTPNFKARDIDFKEALRAVVAGQSDTAVVLKATSPRHMAGGADTLLSSAIKYRTEFQPSADGNTVNMDIERSAFAENALRVEAALTFIRGHIKDMQLAMSQ